MQGPHFEVCRFLAAELFLKALPLEATVLQTRLTTSFNSVGVCFGTPPGTPFGRSTRAWVLANGSCLVWLPDCGLHGVPERDTLTALYLPGTGNCLYVPCL